MDAEQLKNPVETLLELELISAEEAADWPTKLLG
jgi:hypothetical protein